MNYVYILLCSDNTLYTGWTTNPEKRLKAHNDGKGAKYTSPRLPVKIVHLEEYEDKKAALRREAEIKRLSRKDKFSLIEAVYSNGLITASEPIEPLENQTSPC